jgi:hypothetical protein
MIYEYPIPEFWSWFTDLSNGPFWYLLALLIILLVVSVVGFLVSLIRNGPAVAGERTYAVLAGSFLDLVHLSPRRVWAMSKLVLLDSWRRKVWVVLILYGVLLLFASQYLSPTTQNPAKLSIGFVLSYCTRYLILLIMLVLSVFSIPLDFKNRTIFTVVTKPVSMAEYVLGRIGGFVLLGTGMLLFMAVVGYLFLHRTLIHTHELTPATIAELNAYQNLPSSIPENERNAKKPKDLLTELENRHQHRIDPDKPDWTEYEFGHRHEIIAEKNAAGETVYTVAPPEDLLQARVQHLGELKFKDRKGLEADKGVNVGKEWKLRSFIEGASPMEAYWTFKNVTPDGPYKDGLHIERTIRIFRTEQGKIDEPLAGSMFVRNPDTKVTSKAIPFKAKDTIIDSDWIPADGLRISNSDGTETRANLFKDFVNSQGQVEIVIKCNAPRQYFGMSPRDVYIRDPDVAFGWNYIKGVLCIWLQMLIVICCGVIFSTFVSAPVALLATAGFLFLGLYTQFVGELVTSQLDFEETARGKTYYGGGPVESLYRIVTQTGVTLPLEKTFGVRLMRMVDTPLLWLMRGVNQGVPNFDEYNTLTIVGQGFDIPNSLIWHLTFKAFYFCLVAFLLGLGFMRLREVAK